MTPEDVFAVLVKEPYNLTPAQIGALTPYQVRHLYFRKDADKGSTPLDAYVKEKELFWKQMKDWNGLPEEEVQRLWREHVKKQEQARPPRGGKKNKE